MLVITQLDSNINNSLGWHIIDGRDSTIILVTFPILCDPITAVDRLTVVGEGERSSSATMSFFYLWGI